VSRKSIALAAFFTALGENRAEMASARLRSRLGACGAVAFIALLAACSGSVNTTPAVVPVGTITEYGGSLSAPYGITAGPDGNLWFTEFNNGKIGKIVP
jgi:streptogramin lyase